MSALLRMLTVIVSLSIGFVFFSSAHCQERSCIGNEVFNTSFYFGNGVWTDAYDAGITLREIENAIKFVVPTEDFHKIDFYVARNTTHGYLEDLLEAFIQDISTDVTAFWMSMAGFPMPSALKDKIIEFSTMIDEAALINNQDLSIQVTHYKNNLSEGKYVLVVAHSQGNFFANQAYGNLTESEKQTFRFNIVGVANPDSFIATNGPHITLVEDLVIQAITSVKQSFGLPVPQPPNVTNLITLADLTGHFFEPSYFVPNSNSRARILDNIIGYLCGGS